LHDAAKADRARPSKESAIPSYAWLVLGVVGVLFYGPLFFFGSLSILRTAIHKIIDLVSAGGWKPAMFVAAILSLVAIIYWVKKNSA